jgi:hypothetical protein
MRTSSPRPGTWLRIASPRRLARSSSNVLNNADRIKKVAQAGTSSKSPANMVRERELAMEAVLNQEKQ